MLWFSGELVYFSRAECSSRPYPEGTSCEGDHATCKARFLALWSDTLVHAFPQPDVGLHIPRIQEDFQVGRELNRQDLNVRRSFPTSLA